MRGFAALMLIAGFSSCVKDVDGLTPAQEEEKAKENAELQLGLNIPDGQTWEMSTQVSANVTIDLESSEKYRVGICDKNPITFSDAKFYVFKEAENGSISTKFTAPKGKSEFYVVTYNSKNQSLVNKVEAVNGVINANISYTSASSRAMRGANRATEHGITFPDAPAATDYATAAPVGTEDIRDYNGYYGGKGTFYADENSDGKQVQINSTGGVIYFVKKSSAEHVTIAPNPLYMAGGTRAPYDNSLSWDDPNQNRPLTPAERTHIYVCPGVTLKLNANDAKNLQTGVMIYIANGATLETEGYLVLNTLCIYNAGTIKVHGDLTLNASNVKGSPDISVLYNQGTIDVDGYLSPQNGNCYVVNEKKITADKFGSEGSGSLWNVTGGEIDITNSTVVNSNSNGWVNDGKYTTNTFLYNAGSVDVYNSCKLTVKSNFEINLGDSPTSAFYNEGAIVCEKDFLFSGPGRIIMASGALLDVQGTATMQICNPRKYGIWGPESVAEGAPWAVFKANQVVAGKDDQGLISYGGKLAIVCNSHFDQGWKGQYPIIAGGGEDGSGPTELTIYKGGAQPNIPAIEPSECNPGFKPGPGPDPVPEPEVYSYAFEDQIYNGDYDMNDVVLKVSYHAVREQGVIKEIDESKLDIKLVASGATFNIKVYLGQRDANGKPIENPVALFGDQEIHAAFGVSEGVMVNTGRNIANVVTLTGVTPPTGWNGDFKNLDIWIWVNPGSGSASETQIFYLTDKEKPVPYAIMIPADWKWPTERTCITKAYPGAATSTEGVYNKEFSFAKWAETPDDQRTDNMKEWFKHPATGLTMTNN